MKELKVLFENVYSAKAYPLYTKRLMEKSNFYIDRNGEILKNRGDMFISKENEMANFNNIVIENGKYIDIYCKRDYVENYNQVIEWLEINCYKDIKDYIQIYSR